MNSTVSPAGSVVAEIVRARSSSGNFGNDEERIILREAALGALKRDLAAKRDHILMARTRSKQRADEIHQIYLRLAPELKPLVVYSGAGQTLANRTAVQALLDREQTGSRIIVCVDMLGEGFDLPNLKVAALHDAHKSLAILPRRS